MPNSPQTKEIESKWLIHPSVDVNDLPLGSDLTEITQVYLTMPGKSNVECRVRKKVKNGKTSYEYTEKVVTQDVGVREESTEEDIDEERFNGLVSWYASPECKSIHKTRFKIPSGNRFLEVDIYFGDHTGLSTIEREFESLEELNAFVLPEPFASVSTNVTRDKRYSNRMLAEHGIPVS